MAYLNYHGVRTAIVARQDHTLLPRGDRMKGHSLGGQPFGSLAIVKFPQIFGQNIVAVSLLGGYFQRAFLIEARDHKEHRFHSLWGYKISRSSFLRREPRSRLPRQQSIQRHNSSASETQVNGRSCTLLCKVSTIQTQNY